MPAGEYTNAPRFACLPMISVMIGTTVIVGLVETRDLLGALHQLPSLLRA